MTGPGGTAPIADKSVNTPADSNQPQAPPVLDPGAAGTGTAGGRLPSETQVAGSSGSIGNGTTPRISAGISMAIAGGLVLALMGTC